ncbi:glycosyltransferase [Pediococcus acidilactici]|nr:glycosyltransferase [Pediococcus acidilactici]KAF0345842.1 glycosyltransferase [Pediococcus acidilactici]KAF0355346.1 glycosyltransferase [Pediococcus acidilactici]KAF0359727.1 glycosyltransferase [Pediococcus acidilactici]KAF0364656.1 glycosyltransferase [Pediococcus acidilactici]
MILVVSNMYPSRKFPNYGVFVKNFVQELSQTEEVKVVALKKKQSKFLKGLGYLIFYLRVFFNYVSGKYSLVYVHYAGYNVPPILLGKFFNRKVPLIVNVHGSDVTPEKRLEEKTNFLTKKIVKKADLTVVPSAYFKEVVENKYGKIPIFVSPSSGVNRNLFKKQEVEKSTAELLNQDPYDLLTKIAGEAPAGSKGLLFHPFLGGERALIWSGNARGSFFGLTQTHTRAHMLRAILEGIVYNLFTVNLALEEVMPEGDRQILATGGFAHSELWKHILADVFEEPVKVPKSVEGGCMGAMVIAQISLGLAKNLTKVEDFLVKDAVNTYEPNPANFRAYRDLMPIYIRLSRELAGEYDSIAEYQRTH